MEVKIPILNDDYKVVVCWGTARDILKVLEAYYYEDVDLKYVVNALENRRGVTFRKDRCYPIIALPKRPKTPEEMGTLAHEACHAVKEIFDYIQESEIDEVFANSVGAIVRHTLSAKEKKNLKTKR